MPRPPSDETEPDYRFTLANERTFLSWTRTCLALLASAVAVVQFAPDLGSRTFREVAAVVLAALAAVTSVGGLWRWYLAQRLMRRGQSLGHSPLPLVLGATLALVALAVLIVLLVELAS